MAEVGARARFRGCLVGLAAGDALGSTLKFRYFGSFEPIDDMVGGGLFDLKPGQWTDDTSMALCLAASLIEREEFDPSDQMRRYVRWWREGYMSSTGRCFDIGISTARALSRFVETGDPYSGPTDPVSAGNGSLMRLAPVPMYFAGDPAEAIALSADSSRTTHGAEEAVDACRYFAGLLVGALQGGGQGGAPFTSLLPHRGVLGEESTFAERSQPWPRGRSGTRICARFGQRVTWWIRWRRCCAPSTTPMTSARAPSAW